MAQPVPPRVAPGARILAIGDIHGRLDLLDDVLDRADRRDREDGRRSTLVFLGDLVDRGPDSRGVVARCRGLADSRDCFFLKGNHEEILLTAAQGVRSALALFDRVGGRDTLLSYGVDPDIYDHSSLGELHDLVVANIPRDDLDFLEGFGDMFSSGDYHFVHAGVRPSRPLNQQSPQDLRWIREPFLSHQGQLGGMIVHGHTIVERPTVGVNKIGIDTGAYATGTLTALLLQEDQSEFIDTR